MNFKICPRCEIEYCDWVAVCPRCGDRLVKPEQLGAIDLPAPLSPDDSPGVTGSDREVRSN